MSRLIFPIYHGISVRPQGNGATTTDIILQNKTMLPKVVLRSEITSQKKKHITLVETKNEKDIKSFDQLSEEKKQTSEELKVRSITLNEI